MRFDEYVATRGADILRLAYVLTANRHDAEDLAQATLAKVYSSWPRVAAARDPNAYVRRICVNKFISRRRLFSSRDVVMAELGAHLPAKTDETDTVADRIDLRQLLGRLPRRARVALVMRYYLDQTDEQIAAVLDVKPATVRSLIHRGLRAAREMAEASHTDVGKVAEAEDAHRHRG